MPRKRVQDVLLSDPDQTDLSVAELEEVTELEQFQFDLERYNRG
jgi:hypothetical protein